MANKGYKHCNSNWTLELEDVMVGFARSGEWQRGKIKALYESAKGKPFRDAGISYTSFRKHPQQNGSKAFRFRFKDEMAEHFIETGFDIVLRLGNTAEKESVQLGAAKELINNGIRLKNTVGDDIDKLIYKQDIAPEVKVNINAKIEKPDCSFVRPDDDEEIEWEEDS